MTENYPYQCTLNEDLIEFAEKELNEKSSWRDRDIQALRDMVQTKNELKCPLDGSFLLRFLRARKFDYDHAYQLLIKYYTAKATNHQQLKDLTPSKCMDLIDAGIIVLLPSRDSMGRRVIYVQLAKWKPEEVEMIRLLQIVTLTMEHVIKDEETQVMGVVVVVDVSGVGLTHLRHIEMSFINAITHLMQQAFPLRIRAIHFINEPFIFSHLFTLIRPFLTHKMLSRHHFHGSSLDSLHKAVGAHALPLELEGKLQEGDVLAQAWKDELSGEEAYFEELNQHHAILPSHITDTPTASTSYCLSGLYRKLNF